MEIESKLQYHSKADYGVKIPSASERRRVYHHAIDKICQYGNMNKDRDEVAFLDIIIV